MTLVKAQRVWTMTFDKVENTRGLCWQPEPVAGCTEWSPAIREAPYRASRLPRKGTVAESDLIYHLESEQSVKNPNPNTAITKSPNWSPAWIFHTNVLLWPWQSGRFDSSSKLWPCIFKCLKWMLQPLSQLGVMTREENRLIFQNTKQFCFHVYEKNPMLNYIWDSLVLKRSKLTFSQD